MDIETASESEIEIFSNTFEKLNIPKYNFKMEENPMVETVTNPVETTALDILESSNAARFRPRYSRTPTARDTTYVHSSVKQEYDSPMDQLRP